MGQHSTKVGNAARIFSEVPDQGIKHGLVQRGLMMVDFATAHIIYYTTVHLARQVAA